MSTLSDNVGADADTGTALLRALAHLILSALDTIDARCAALGTSFPSPDAPVPHAPSSPVALPPDRVAQTDAEVQRAMLTVAAAAGQLAAAVRAPEAAVLQAAGAYHLSVALRSAAELHVAEILREAGPEGLHASHIAAKTGTDPAKLARILRYLATQHIFAELSPDVFANNRTSSVLDKGQPVDVLLADRERIYDKPQSGVSALACLFTDETLKSGAYVLETLSDPATAHSGEPGHTAFARWAALAWPELAATGEHTASAEASGKHGGAKTPDATAHGAGDVGASVWDFYARERDLTLARTGTPGVALRRFGVAMEAATAGRLQPVEEVLRDFDWAALPQGARVVDVGGGVGALATLLVRGLAPHVRVQVQDRPETVAEGVERWKQSPDLRQALDEGIVSFHAHDFFTPQPHHPTPAAVFLLKHILHDWSDAYAARILRHVRDAASAETRLLVLEPVLPHACRTKEGEQGTVDDDGGERVTIPGVYQPSAPAPLLPNWGAGNPMPYTADMVMLTLFNGQERTLAQARALLKQGGWRLERVRQAQAAGEFLALLEVVPA